MAEMITAWEAIDRVMTKAEEAGGWSETAGQREGGVMTDLRWAIDKIDEPGSIGWYIFDTKTDTTICESMVLEPLETIIELLAACEAEQVSADHQDECLVCQTGGVCSYAFSLEAKAAALRQAAIANVTGDE